MKIQQLNKLSQVLEQVSLDLRPRAGVYSSKNRRSRLYAQSPIKPKVLAEKGGLIFARVRYNASTACMGSK